MQDSISKGLPEIERQVAERQAMQSHASVPEVQRRAVLSDADIQADARKILLILDGRSPSDLNRILNTVRLSIQWYGLVTMNEAARYVSDVDLNGSQCLEPIL